MGIAAYYAILFVLTEGARVWYIASACIAFCFNQVVTFFFNKRWSFKCNDKTATRAQMRLYFVMGAVTLVGNAALLALLVEVCKMHYLRAQFILIVVFSGISYFLTQKIFAKYIPPL